MDIRCSTSSGCSGSGRSTTCNSTSSPKIACSWRMPSRLVLGPRPYCRMMLINPDEITPLQSTRSDNFTNNFMTIGFIVTGVDSCFWRSCGAAHIANDQSSWAYKNTVTWINTVDGQIICSGKINNLGTASLQRI